MIKTVMEDEASPWASRQVREAVLRERARCKLVVQMNQCRCGFACDQLQCARKKGRFSMKMLDEIDNGTDYSHLLSQR